MPVPEPRSSPGRGCSESVTRSAGVTCCWCIGISPSSRAMSTRCSAFTFPAPHLAQRFASDPGRGISAELNAAVSLPVSFRTNIGTIRMSVPKGQQPSVVSQPVLAPLTRAAIFLVVCVKPDRESYAGVRSLCSDLPGIFRAVDFRRIEAGLSCVVAFGSDAWDQIFGKPRPAALHPFREIRSEERHAVSTPADLLFHIP